MKSSAKVGKKGYRTLVEPLKSLAHGHDLGYSHLNGYSGLPEDKDWYNEDAQSELRAKILEINAALVLQNEANSTRAKFGLKPNEDAETIRLDSLKSNELLQYATILATAPEPHSLRTRIRQVPMITHQEIAVLKETAGTDATSQEELRAFLKDESNAALGCPYRDLVTEDVARLNQYTLMKRAQFFHALLSSPSLYNFITKNANATISEWVLCKIFLKQYCNILDRLKDVQTKETSQSCASQHNAYGMCIWLLPLLTSLLYVCLFQNFVWKIVLRQWLQPSCISGSLHMRRRQASTKARNVCEHPIRRCSLIIPLSGGDSSLWILSAV